MMFCYKSYNLLRKTLLFNKNYYCKWEIDFIRYFKDSTVSEIKMNLVLNLNDKDLIKTSG